MPDSALPASALLGQSYELADGGARLLDPAPLSLEMGVARLDSGVLHVAARTDMVGCSGKQFEWWFRFACNTEQYAWWHPLDHGSSRWVETSAQTHIGSTHLVNERLGPDAPYEDLQIHFVDPAELFGDAYGEALERGDISAVVAAQIGNGAEPLRDERGRPNMGRMAHIARDTPTGMVLRSRFWLGQGTGAPAEALRAAIPDEVGIGLMHHAHTEFKYLARILPSLYEAETKETVVPW
jgi:hypothetical protein